MSAEGHEVVLTSEAAIASDTLGSSIVGFISAIPDSYIRPPIDRLLFRVTSYGDGRAKKAPYGLAKVEAKLREMGIDAVISSPYELRKNVGPRTRVIGIYTMDGLGMSYGSGITYWILKLAGVRYVGMPYISRSFFNVLNDMAIKHNRDHLKVVVGGPAAWQVVDSGRQHELGIDVVFEGEFERDGPGLFRSILSGERVPSHVYGRPAPVEDVPVIVTPSNGGLVEVTRGCGRGCAFCSPNLSGGIRSFPFEGHIDREIELNMKVGGSRSINLHSEEFFRYGAKGIDPVPEKVIELVKKAYRLVKSIDRNGRIITDFTTAAVVVEAPSLVSEVADYMNEGGAWSFIEMGIETASARLMDKYMRGKALPYRPPNYPEVVERAIGTLNDNRWIVVGTMIVGFPGEEDDDIIANLELLDRLKGLKVVTFPLPLVPIARFREAGLSTLDELLENPLRKEFVIRALNKAFESVGYGLRLVIDGIENVVERYIMYAVSYAALSIVRSRYARALKEIEVSRLRVEGIQGLR